MYIINSKYKNKKENDIMLKCKVSTRQFQEGLKKLNQYKVNKDLQSLQGIKLNITDDRVQLMRTDLANYITITIEDVVIIEPASIIINNPKEIEKSFKYMKDTYTEINIDKDTITIKNGGKSLKLKGSSSDDFPKLPKGINLINKYNYNTKTLYNRLKKIDFARSKDDLRPILTGVCFNECDMATLDGYRLAVDRDYNLEVKNNFVINDGLIQFLLKTLNKKNENDLTLATNEEYIQVEYENISILSKLLEGHFLNYKEILPNNYKEEFQIETKKLKDNIDFLSTYSKDIKSEITVMIAENNNLELKVTTGEGIFKVDTEINEDINIKIAFNNKFMRETLKEVEKDEILIGYNGFSNPLMIEDNSTKYMILPIRLSEEEYTA